MTIPEQAQQQLRHAEQLHRQVASFNPVWITYTGLCAASFLFTMGTVWAPESPLPLSLALIWAMLSVCLIGVFSVAYMCLSFAGPAWEVWRNR